MKKLYTICFVLVAIMLFNIISTFAMTLEYDGEKHEYTAAPIKLVVNGELLTTEVPPVILEGRTLVPARDVFEKLGATVVWEAKYRNVYVTYKGIRVILTINSQTAYINQNSSQLDVPAKIINDKTMIPAAFVAKSLGFVVNWDGTKRIVYIKDKDNTTEYVDSDEDKTVLGYATYYSSRDTASYNSMVTNKDSLDQVVTHTYTVDNLGNLTGLIPSSQISYAKKNGIKVEASVSNQFNSAIAKKLLESSENRARLITNISTELKKYGYDGISIDLENVPAEDRSYMTTFMKDLYNTLQPKGYSISIALPAKTYDSKTSSISGAFDYAALSNYADVFVIMAYDEHYAGGTAGAIASIGWVEKVVKYAATVLPEDKTLLGLASYGFDWSASGTKSYSILGAYNVAAKYGATVKLDTSSKSPYYTYTDEKGVKHDVWFENAESIGYKLDLVNNYDLQGISIWTIGYVNDEYMKKINEKLE